MENWDREKLIKEVSEMLDAGKLNTRVNLLTDLTLESLENLLAKNPGSQEIFGDDKHGFLKRVRVLCHPDRYVPGTPQALRADKLRKLVEALASGSSVNSPIVVTSPDRRYLIHDLIAVGSVADIYEATSGYSKYLIKVARNPHDNDLLEIERLHLVHILGSAGSLSYQEYFPKSIASFIPEGDSRRLNIFVQETGFYTLEDVRKKYPKGLDPRHLGWIFNRILIGLGFVHRCGLIHGAVFPPHVQIHAQNHGAQLLGWGQSVKAGEVISRGTAQYLSWYPPEVIQKRPASFATDLYMAAQCMIYLAGEDPGATLTKSFAPWPFYNFFRACLLQGQSMRPGDAWSLHQEFQEVLRALYGSPKYVALEM